MNPIATAKYGMFTAANRFDASAQRVARMGDADSDVDMVQETVEQIEAKTAYSANLSVIRAADRMTGDLLNMIA